MRLPIIIIATSLLITAARAQEQKKEYKVRIKKVEVINGQERVFDTTFVTSDPANFDFPDMPAKQGPQPLLIEKDISENGKAVSKVFILKDTGSESKSIAINIGDEMSQADMEKMKNMPVQTEIINIPALPSDSMIKTRVMIKSVRCGASAEEIEKAPLIDEVYIIRKAQMTDLNQKDIEALKGKPALKYDNKLFADDIKFSPNPNNGKFNLSFSLSGIGSAHIQILSQEGKAVYDETLSNFTGRYNRDIDISTHPKGVYYARISQGEHSQMKKIVLE